MTWQYPFERPWPLYDKLRALQPTAFDPHKPGRETRLTLDGDMERYVWFLNNKSLSETDHIEIKRDEVMRFIMINRTMMHHPMHPHGHFFRVLNAQREYSPFKHTVDVAPMKTTVIEFAAKEFGDWFFHCHLLYHMESGMARVMHYQDFTPDPATAAVRQRLYHDQFQLYGLADVLSRLAQGGWFMPIHGIFSPLHGDTAGEFQFAVGKPLEHTPRLAVLAEAEYDAKEQWESLAGTNYLLTKHFSLIGQWHSRFGWPVDEASKNHRR
jgi:hypothetical protein